MPHGLLVVIFALMGAGGSLCSSTAQSSAFINITRHAMPDASALWNINRQLSFLIGATLLASLLSALQPLLSSADAWHWTFFVAAGITLLPVFSALRLDNHNVIFHLQKEKP
jgi:MFS family permease